MIFFLIITILYILFVILELYLINRYITSSHEKDILFNKKSDTNNNQEIEFLCNMIKNRLEKLKTMNYNQWLKYNQEHVLINFDNEKLYVFIYDLGKDTNTLFLRTHVLDQYLNMEANTFESYVKDKSAYFSQHKNYNIVSKDMYNSIEWDNGCSQYSYVWSDPLADDRPIIKKSIGKTFKKQENGLIINGYIGIGYTSSILLNTIKYYFEYVQKYFLFLLFFFIYLITIISYYFNGKQMIKCFLLFIILNGYVVFSLLLKDILTNIQYESKLVTELNSSILGISFLVVANTFIINTLKDIKNNKLFYETSFLFCASLISLMLAMFKISSFFKTSDIKTYRIQNQILFNISIIINIFIFFNYFSSIYFKPLHR